MTPTQLRTTITRLQLSQRRLARMLKVDVRTVTRWVAGDAPIPEAVHLLLECWQREPLKRR